MTVTTKFSESQYQSFKTKGQNSVFYPWPLLVRPFLKTGPLLFHTKSSQKFRLQLKVYRILESAWFMPSSGRFRTPKVGWFIEITTSCFNKAHHIAVFGEIVISKKKSTQNKLFLLKITQFLGPNMYIV